MGARDPRAHRALPIVLLTAGLLLATICGIALLRDRRAVADFGTFPAITEVPASTNVASNEGKTTGPLSSAAALPAAAPSTPVRPVQGPSARLTRSAASSTPVTATTTGLSSATAGIALPIRLAIPGQAVTAPVEPVVSSNGVLAVPEQPTTVGWWSASARPGSGRGPIVIVGHVDSATLGVGALFHLSDLEAGAAVQIQTSARTTITYTVVARRSFEKAAGLPPSLFAPTDAEQLLLISCGGAFNEATKSYEDNVVVLAARRP